MLGAVAEKGKTLPGLITEKPLSEETTINDAIDFLESFVTRENPPNNSIYRLRFMLVQPSDNSQPVLAMTCEVDPDGPLYVGDTLSLDQKAIIIANEWGTQKKLDLNTPANTAEGPNRLPHQKTIYSYLTEMVDARLQKGFPIEDEMWDLLAQTNYYRQQMDPNKRTYLEYLESGIRDDGKPAMDQELNALKSEGISRPFKHAQQTRRNLDDRVLVTAGGPDLTETEYETQLLQARNALRTQLDMKPLADKPLQYREVDNRPAIIS